MTTSGTTTPMEAAINNDFITAVLSFMQTRWASPARAASFLG